MLAMVAGASDDGGPGGEPLGVFVLRDRDQREAGFERGRQQFAGVVDHVVDAHHMIVDVAEIRPRVLVDQVDVEARQAIADVDQRRDRALHAEQFALQLVDAGRGLAAQLVAEDLAFEHFQFVFERLDDRENIDRR